MKKLTNAVFAFAVLTVGLWLAAQPSYGNPDFAKKEKKGCTYCHPAGKTAEFTEAGQYYKDHDFSFEGYTPKDGGKGK